MNRWGIPDWLEREVIERDTRCVYCGIEFDITCRERRTKPSWEHIVNDASIVTLANIARCCTSCNSSKGTKPLSLWLQSPYCRQRGIAPHTVAAVVEEALRSGA